MQEREIKVINTAEEAFDVAMKYVQFADTDFNWTFYEFHNINFKDIFGDDRIGVLSSATFNLCIFDNCIFTGVPSDVGLSFIDCRFFKCVIKDICPVFSIDCCEFCHCNLQHIISTSSNMVNCTAFHDVTFEDVICKPELRMNATAVTINGGSITDCDFSTVDAYDIRIDSDVIIKGTEHPFIKYKCPDGEFIGYKVASFICATSAGSDCIVKLRIPETAKRIASINGKCRCNEAYVEGIYGIDTGEELDGFAVSKYVPRLSVTSYIKGKHVTVDKFDDDPVKECAAGIHFFLTIEEAKAYAKKY